MKKILFGLFLAFSFGLMCLPSAQAANRFWVGGSGNWSQTSHWSTSSGGSGGASVPGSSDRARFNSNSGGGTCTIDQNVNVRGISMESGNTTAVSQGTYTVTVGNQDGVFTSGTFTGGSGTIDFTDVFRVNGGTFTAPSATLSVTNNTTFSSGVFSGGSGDLDFNRNLTISGAAFTASSATTSVANNFTFNAGTFSHNSGAFVFDTNNATLRPGSAVFNDVTFDGVARTYTLANNETLVVSGTLTFTDIRVNGSATTFIDAKGNVVLDATTDRGTTTLRLNGTSDQTITCSGTAPGGFLTDDVVINKSSGDAYISGNCQLNNVALTDGTFTFQGGATYTIDDADAITAASGTTLNFSGSSGNLVLLRSDTTAQWDLTVNAAASYTATFVDVEYSNAGGGREIVASESVDRGNNTNWSFPTKLVFTTGVQNIQPNTSSSAITVQLQSNSAPVNVPSNTQINLTSDSATGLFSETPLFSSTVTSVTIPVGSSSATFYYKDSAIGTHTMTAAESPSKGWTDATQVITVETQGAWRYKVPVTVTSSDNLTDFQVLITLDTQTLIAATKMNTDGSDIRVFDSDDSTSLSFWIEEGTINTSTTKIWVKLPQVVAPSKIIYVYYGNTLASSASNITNTFIFGDDFSSGALSTSKWNTSSLSSSNLAVSGDELRGTNTGTITTGLLRSQASFTAPFVLEESMRVVSFPSGGITTIGTYTSNTDKFGVRAFGGAGSNPSRYRYWNNNSQSTTINTGTLFLGQHRETITASSSSSVTLTLLRSDTSESSTQTVSNAISAETIALGHRIDTSGNNQAYSAFWDWVFVRKHNSSDPTTSVGAEIRTITQLSFTTSEQTLRENEVSAVMTVQAQDFSGLGVNVSSNTVLDLSSSSGGGEFSDSPAFTSTIDQITILSGSSSVEFYYRDSVVGTPTITVSENPSQGWTDATQDVTIIPGATGFSVVLPDTLVAGAEFSMTVTALDDNGNVATGYNDPTTLTVSYISPVSGSGVLSTTLLNSFINGVAVISNQTFSDCGTIVVTATQQSDPSNSGSSSNGFFAPSSFSLNFDNLDNASNSSHAVNKAFELAVTALTSSGSTCIGYQGPATLSINNVDPSTSQGGTVTPSSLTSTNWSSGVAEIGSTTYDKWGQVSFTCTDDTLATQAGTSSNITFVPKDFQVLPEDPSPSRTFFYVDEPFDVTVTARDQNDAAIENYQGTISFSATGMSLPDDFTFTVNELGTVTFSDVSGSIETDDATITVTDTSFPTVMGVSDSISIKQAFIQAFSNQGPVGPLAITVSIVDSGGDVIIEDDSTTFTVTLDEFSEDGSATSETTTVPLIMTAGTATVTVTNNQAEAVEVTPQSTPELEAVSGTATFGTLSGSGLGIQIYRELKDPYEE